MAPVPVGWPWAFKVATVWAVETVVTGTSPFSPCGV
jgi:hypothetical protein